MNVYRKLLRFVAKQLGYLATKMEPFSSQDDLSKFKGYYSDAVEDASTIRLTRNGHTITLRKASSDLLVFEQLFIYKEYSELVDLIRLNKISIRTVIDLGANIGLATIYLRENFPDATFICAEPDERNFESLQANLSGYDKTVLYQKAIWSTQKNIYLNRNFRDGKDWAIAVSNNKSGSYAEVNTMTIDEIILHNNLDKIDLIKIDIEGAEAELFKESEQNDFLDKVKVIAIEIHNEFNVRDSIISQLINHNFLLVESKQTLVAISASCIQNSMNHVTNNQSVI